MTRGDLVLWMLVYPWPTVAVGVALAVASYVLARPVRAQACHALRIESWRLWAILASAPAFFVGAEAVLWGRLLAWRAPLVFTGLPWAAGLWLVALAPVPALAWWTWRSWAAGGGPARPEVVSRRPLWLAAGLAIAGLGLMLGGEAARLRAWTALTDSALVEAGPPAQRPAVATIVRLRAHRYVDWPAAAAALDRVVPTAADALAVAGAPAGGLDREQRAYFARRIEAGLEAGAPGLSAAYAVPRVWALTGDPDRTIRAYALTVADLRPTALDAAWDLQAAAEHALREAPPAVVATVLMALDADASQIALALPLVDALVAHVDDPAPEGATAVALLLRDGSAGALRPLLPRFVDAAGARADYDGPIWRALRDRCIQRAAALPALTEDADARVAAGAREVLAYVRQYCRKGRPQQ